MEINKDNEQELYYKLNDYLIGLERIEINLKQIIEIMTDKDFIFIKNNIDDLVESIINADDNELILKFLYFWAFDKYKKEYPLFLEYKEKLKELI